MGLNAIFGIVLRAVDVALDAYDRATAARKLRDAALDRYPASMTFTAPANGTPWMARYRGAYGLGATKAEAATAALRAFADGGKAGGR
jgi:hypothetical protein